MRHLESSGTPFLYIYIGRNLKVKTLFNIIFLLFPIKLNICLKIYGNEMAERVAKEATQNHYVTYSRIPKSAIKKETREESIRKWQSQ